MPAMRCRRSRRDIGSPIRTLRTGFQKTAKVLSDMLLLGNVAQVTSAQLRNS